jgi:phosphoribosylglycinamide formyltransferase 1
MARLRLGVLISGRGSNLQALIDATRAPDYPAEVTLVISNESHATGLVRAGAAGISARLISHRQPRFEATIDTALRDAGIELVCLAGFMRVLSGDFVRQWGGRLVNIHPSLLPAFPGLDTHRRALAAGATSTGCTVHFVSDAVDAGPIIAQSEVPIRSGDDEASLAARVLAEEHRLYPRVVRLIAEGRVHVDGDKVEIR